MTDQSLPHTPQEVPQRAWAKWAVVIFLGVATFFGAIFGGVFYLLSHTEAYQLGVSRLQASAEVANLIGSPITTGIPWGSIRISGASGHAALSFSVTGPKGQGRAFLEATKENGIWSLRSLRFRVDGRDTVIDIINPARADIGYGRRLLAERPQGIIKGIIR